MLSLEFLLKAPIGGLAGIDGAAPAWSILVDSPVHVAGTLRPKNGGLDHFALVIYRAMRDRL